MTFEDKGWILIASMFTCGLAGIIVGVIAAAKGDYDRMKGAFFMSLSGLVVGFVIGLILSNLK